MAIPTSHVLHQGPMLRTLGQTALDALLHAERLTRLLADAQICGILLEQAQQFPERRELLERYLDRAEPRCRMLHEEITTTGHRILSSLSPAAVQAERNRGAA